MNKSIFYFLFACVSTASAVMDDSAMVPVALREFMHSYGNHFVFPFSFTFIVYIMVSSSGLGWFHWLQPTGRIIALNMVLTTILEGVQVYMPGRHFDWWDIFAQLVGAGASGIILYHLRKRE